MPQRYVIFQHLQHGGRAAQYLNGGEQPGAQHRRLTSAPSLYHRRTSAASSSDFGAKSEDEAAKVGRWIGGGTAEASLGCPPFRHLGGSPLALFGGIPGWGAVRLRSLQNSHKRCGVLRCYGLRYIELLD